MGDVPAHERPPSIAFVYPVLLFLGAHAWLVFYDLSEQGLLAHASYVVQQLVLVLLFMLVDSRLQSAPTRFFLASFAALYIAFVHFDAMLINVVGLSSVRVLAAFIGGGWSSLSEIGLKPLRIFLLVLTIVAMCLGGGVLHRIVDRWRARSVPRPLLHAGWVSTAFVLPLAFFGEQVLSRDADRYLYRSMELPGYFQIYHTATRSREFVLPSPVETVARHAHLDEIGPARNPRHLLFVLLESLRADVISPEVSPSLHALSQSSLNFRSAYSEALFTPLSWNVILLDRPVHMFIWPRTMLAPREHGSWPLSVLRRAGYRIWISSSTDLEYGHFLPFLLGKEKLVDRFHVPEGDDLRRWQRDDRATAQLIDWIDSSSFDEPTFMMLQLDTTHWTYEFPPGAALMEPYSPELSMPVPLTTEEEFRLLHNRYLNCVHHVDRKIGEVLEALEDRGLRDEIAIAVVADHGEGFSPGVQGHSVLCEGTTRVPLMLQLPGIEPAQIDQPVSFRNVFPTLFDYLDIQSFDQTLMLGRSVLPPGRGESEILMFSTDGRRADLRLADGTRIQFTVLIDGDRASFTPIGVQTSAGAQLENPWPLVEMLPWQNMVEQRLRWQQPPGAIGPELVTAEGPHLSPERLTEEVIKKEDEPPAP